MDQRIIDDLVIECGMAPQSYFWEFNHWARWQFRLLASQLKIPRDTQVLDVGCGAMRLGHLLVPYLEDDRYCGIDALEPYIRFAHRLMEKTGVKKKYNLHASAAFDFDHFGRQFDFAFAQSVLGHLSKHENEVCFDNLKKVMKPGSRFLATVAMSGRGDASKVGFFYNGTYPFRRPLFEDLSFVKQLCADRNLNFRELETDHPGQALIEVTF